MTTLDLYGPITQPEGGGGGGSVEALTDDEMLTLLYDSNLFEMIPAVSSSDTLYALTMPENGVQKLLYV